jgi:hypothetical protein
LTRETTLEKAARLLVAGRLRVVEVEHGRVRASCRGDHGAYDLGGEGGVWSCSCPARGDCSHLRALRLVVDQPRSAPS